MNEQEQWRQSAVRPPGELPGGRIGRRGWLAGICCIGLAGVAPGARAHGGAALSMQQLVRQSSSVVVATPLAAQSMWQGRGRDRRIVTLVEAEVHEAIDGRAGPQGSVIIRTLGGQVGDIGQVVPGAAQLILFTTSVCFLCPARNGSFAIAGMAQGHYVLDQDDVGTPRLLASEMGLHAAGTDTACAVHRLHGHSMTRCQRLVREELGR